MILRKGMWVNYRGQVGILIPEKAGVDTILTVHLVDDKGATTQVVPVEVGEFSQAAWKDIPTTRRPNEATARRLGYL